MLDHGGSPFRSVRYAERSRLAVLPRILVVVGVVVLLVVVGGAVGVWVTASSAIRAHQVAGLARADERVTNLLVVTAPSDGDDVDGIAVVQLARSRPRPAVLVLPTALELDVPDTGRMPIAAVPGVGGMALLVEEVARYTGVDIHHYVRLDRSELVALVDANGGLDDCPTPDTDVCPRLIGAQVADRLAPPEDAVTGMPRVVAHLAVARVLADEVSRARTVADPRRALRWSRGWDASLTTDVDPGVGGARDLAAELRGVDVRDIDVRILPGLVDDGRITVQPETATVLLESFAQVTPLPADIGLEAPRALEPGDVTVQVLNGLGRAGVAGEMATFLEERGFVVADVDNAPRYDRTAPTTIAHAEPSLPLAELVAEALPDAELEESSDLPEGVDVVVTVGRGGAP